MNEPEVGPVSMELQYWLCCLAEGYRNRDQCLCVDHCGSGRTLACILCVCHYHSVVSLCHVILSCHCVIVIVACHCVTSLCHCHCVIVIVSRHCVTSLCHCHCVIVIVSLSLCHVTLSCHRVIVIVSCHVHVVIPDTVQGVQERSLRRLTTASAMLELLTMLALEVDYFTLHCTIAR